MRFLIIFIFFLPSTSYAYLGPGMAGGVIVSLLGILLAIIMGIFGILYYPIKRYLKNKKNKNIKNQSEFRKDKKN